MKYTDFKKKNLVSNNRQKFLFFRGGGEFGLKTEPHLKKVCLKTLCLYNTEDIWYASQIFIYGKCLRVESHGMLGQRDSTHFYADFNFPPQLLSFP